MATKTISIDLEAYERLRSARQSATESFSKVIHRAHWSVPPHDAAAFLDAIEALEPVDEAALDALDAAQVADAPPESAWECA